MGSCRPFAVPSEHRNLVRAPIFKYGDFVLWDFEGWELDVVDSWRIKADVFSLPIGGVADRVSGCAEI